MKHVRARASEVAGPSVVLTFSPHPARLLRPEKAPIPLTSDERKAELLGRLGIDYMIAYPTTPSLLALSADEFFQQIILSQLRAKHLIEGPNFHFGKNRGGDVNYLGRLCQMHGLGLDVVEPSSVDGQMVSSSRVRSLLSDGQLEQANQLLTRPYRVWGRVCRGAGRGRQIGFPTANLERIETLIPGEGVYAGIATWKEQKFVVAVNIGGNPTFAEQQRKFEVHIVGLKDDLYDQGIAVDLLRRIRDIRTFASPEALTSQLALDVATAREWVEPVLNLGESA